MFRRLEVLDTPSVIETVQNVVSAAQVFAPATPMLDTKEKTHRRHYTNVEVQHTDIWRYKNLSWAGHMLLSKSYLNSMMMGERVKVRETGALALQEIRII